jgi:acyl-ACP thioesterase
MPQGNSQTPDGFTELVSQPGPGRIFELEVRPGFADAAGDGRVRLDGIARTLQDVAYADLVDAGFHGRGAWIVRKLRLRVEAWPRFGEDLSIRTFCSGAGRFAAERRTTIAGSGGLVEAVALWVYLDAETGRPLRFEDDFIAAYEQSAGGRPAQLRLRHPDPPDGVARDAWTFRITDLDVAGHVNNSHYWGPLERELAEATPPGIDAEIEHRAAAGAGEAAVVRGDGAIWIADPGGEVQASILWRPLG